jgi:succinate dehydrogenase flavin-adding protein (antitoxin of CptAB toxin-antitoxin module)
MNTNTHLLLKELQYKCQYTGCRENDLILTKFAEHYLQLLDDNSLLALKDLIASTAEPDIIKCLVTAGSNKNLPTKLTKALNEFFGRHN